MAAPGRLDDLALLAALADGAWHPGDALAARFAVSRAAISKRVGKLQAAGWPVEASRQAGYRVLGGLDLLDAQVLRRTLPRVAVTVLAKVDSTNAAVLAKPYTGPQLVLAEHQTAGRGRRGRNWAAPPGQHLTMTIDWRFEQLAAPATGLAPAIAVAVSQGLGLAAIGIKWPNDLVEEQAGRLLKLGGVLIEASGETGGPLRVVIGIGINVAATAVPCVEQPTTSLRALGDRRSRTAITCCVADAVLGALDAFERSGLAAFADGFAQRDVLANHDITVTGGASGVVVADGLAADGGLQVRTPQGPQTIYSGDVSVRLQ